MDQLSALAPWLGFLVVCGVIVWLTRTGRSVGRSPQFQGRGSEDPSDGLPSLAQVNQVLLFIVLAATAVLVLGLLTGFIGIGVSIG